MGEMSKMPPIALRRLTVRPGLTGLTQAKAREGGVEARLCRDLYYVDHVTLKNDLRIIAMLMPKKTTPSVKKRWKRSKV